MTRRETLVAFLRSQNGYSVAELKAALAIPGVPEFLVRVQASGITNEDLAARLAVFKLGGGAGLANAVASITAELNGAGVTSDECNETLEDIQADLEALLLRVNAAL